MAKVEGDVLHNSYSAVLWAAWINLVWTLRSPAVLLTITAGAAVPMVMLAWAGVITVAQGSIALPAVVLLAVVLAGMASALRTRRRGHLWVAIRPRCPDPHLCCRLGVRAAAQLTLRPDGDQSFHALNLQAWPENHQAAGRLGTAVTSWADRHGFTLGCTCNEQLVMMYQRWGLSVTGTTVGWVPPLRRMTLVTMVREPR